ncbi:microfibril-associated glycoprotein 4-like [Asterias amurensis]|uniref:microfibril-associated glycoprotein 4-like n=1 Tax=Asterias amurensis TaxID=7602 RepID=UPI003AB2D9AC
MEPFLKPISLCKFSLLLALLLVRYTWVSNAQCHPPCEGTESYILAEEPLPSDCKDLQNKGVTKSGVYTIFPQDVYLCISLRVYCDMETDGGGWTVFQRRYDGREDFNTRWMDYRLGFGRLGTEFWLGNEHLHHITMQADYLLRVDLEDFNGKKAWATYVDFRVGTETQNYRLHIGNFTGGKAGDSLSAHSDSPFSTRDSDLSGGACSSFRGGAWWYPRSCGNSNLNARYLAGVHTDFGEGVMWETWRGVTYSLRRTELKFRPMVEADRKRARGRNEHEESEEEEDEKKKGAEQDELFDSEEGGESGDGNLDGDRTIQPRKSKKNKKQ